MLRADCRPPNIAGSQWNAVSSCGDIAIPESMISGVRNEEDAGIRHLLQRIILAFLRRFFADSKVIKNHGRHAGGVFRFKQKLPHVAVGDIVDNV